MRVVVTGSRSYEDRDFVFLVLDRIHAETPIDRLAHGNATGADAFADDWALANKVDVIPYEAQWTAYGDAAGPIRNRMMLTREQPDMVIAFPGETGTWGCIRLARRMGIPVEHAAREPKDAHAALARDLRENGPPQPQMSLFCMKDRARPGDDR